MILLELDPDDSNSIEKMYICANSQILAQHDGPQSTGLIYFYLHDRLGSVRQIIDDAGEVVIHYTYAPFGELIATEDTAATENSFMFTGQYRDKETDLDYLRARQYDGNLIKVFLQGSTVDVQVRLG